VTRVITVMSDDRNCVKYAPPHTVSSCDHTSWTDDGATAKE